MRRPAPLGCRTREVDVVVAHPDDEALWLCPAVERALALVVCYPTHARDPAVTRGWERARSRYPYEPPTFLPLESTGVYDLVGDGSRPSPWGVELKERSDRARRYIDNFDRLVPLLHEHLTGRDIYTHNPWGEYGHYEHVQVCRAVVRVAEVMKTSVWCWAGAFSWADEKNVRRPLGNHLLPHYQGRAEALPRRMLRGNRATFVAIRRAYASTGSWTGPASYVPPEAAEMIQIVDRGRLLLDLE